MEKDRIIMKMAEFAEKYPDAIDMETMGFVSHQFNLSDLSTLSGVSKTTVLAFINGGGITAKEIRIPSGTKMITKKYYDWNDVLSLIQKYKRFKKYPKKKIKIFGNQKGGVGKTSLSTQFAMFCAAMGLKVLFLDIDPQWNSTLAFGINGRESQYLTLFDLLNGAKFEDVVVEIIPNLHLVPSRQALNKAEKYLNQKSNSEMQLKMYLDTIAHDYDLVIGDTNPALTKLSINAFVAADEIDIVSETETFSVSGMNGMFETLDELALEYRYLPYNPAVRIIPNIFDIREGACHDSLVTLKQEYEEYVTTAVVRKSVDFKDAQNKAQAVFLNKKKSNSAQDIEFLAKELLKDEKLVHLIDEEPVSATRNHDVPEVERSIHA
ncbi:MAG: ParA family protein [Proteobacteria bacterium]|nr:MAG: ParA family protein [Pseudomonadota bacterium]